MTVEKHVASLLSRHSGNGEATAPSQLPSFQQRRMLRRCAFKRGLPHRGFLSTTRASRLLRNMLSFSDIVERYRMLHLSTVCYCAVQSICHDQYMLHCTAMCHAESL